MKSKGNIVFIQSSLRSCSHAWLAPMRPYCHMRMVISSSTGVALSRVSNKGSDWRLVADLETPLNITSKNTKNAMPVVKEMIDDVDIFVKSILTVLCFAQETNGFSIPCLSRLYLNTAPSAIAYPNIWSGVTGE